MKKFTVQKETFEFRHNATIYSDDDFKADFSSRTFFDPDTLGRFDSLEEAKAMYDAEVQNVDVTFRPSNGIILVDYLTLNEEEWEDDDFIWGDVIEECHGTGDDTAFDEILDEYITHCQETIGSWTEKDSTKIECFCNDACEDWMQEHHPYYKAYDYQIKDMIDKASEFCLED